MKKKISNGAKYIICIVGAISILALIEFLVSFGRLYEYDVYQDNIVGVIFQIIALLFAAAIGYLWANDWIDDKRSLP